MMKNIFLFLLVSLCTFSATSQESRDYLNRENQYQKAVNLFQQKNYAAAYQLFAKLRLQDNDLSVIPSEQAINSQMYEALSATYAGKQNGILLVEQFLKKYPSHPNNNLARLEIAKYYFQNRDFNAALNNLEQVDANSLPPEKLDEYNMSIGYTYFVRKQFSRAEQYLKQVANNSNSPNQTEAVYYLGLSQYFQKKYDAALSNLKSIEQNPRYYDELPYYFSRILFEQEKYQETIDYVTPLLKDGISNQAEISQIVGQAYFNLEQYEQALPYLKRYSENASKQSPEAQYQLAYTQYQLGMYAEAVKNFEKLNIVDDEIGQYALYAMAESYLKIGEKEKAKNAFASAANMAYNKDIQEVSAFSEAKLNYELERNNEAINSMNAFIDRYPASQFRSEANEMLVELFLTSNNYKDALTILEAMENRSSEMNEAYQKVSYFRAVELYQNGNLSEAKPLFDKTISTPVDDRYVALANYWLGEMAYEYNRYELANDYIQQFLRSSVQKPEQYVSQANYTLGYTHYKQKEYNQAANYFAKVSTGDFMTDASLRAGDSNFALRNYRTAENYYQRVSGQSTTESDYATLQIAILNGLQGKTSMKLNKLQKLYTEKPNSAYADEALYEYARVFVTQENYSRAEQSFQQLISTYPKSDQLLNTYNQLGLINYNQNKYEQAIEYYDEIVQNYPNTEEAQTALATIEEIYIVMGQPDAYFAYLETVDGVNVDMDKKQEIIYQAAESQFQNGNCEKASEGFTNYINQYPRGIYAANAYFYRGECLNQNGQGELAITNYKSVIDLAPNKFVERSLVRVARSEFRNSNYQSAVQYYQQLEKYPNSIYEAEVKIGLMQSYNQLGQRGDAETYAAQVNEMPSVDSSIKTEAQFILAMNEYGNGDINRAKNQLEIIAVKSRNTFGAEARYTIAKILFEQDQYQKSIEACYRVADETPSEDDWVAKSFILIADNYLEMGELFQAKATLESVIDNYTGNDESILEEAKRKRNNILEQEENKSNLISSPETENQLQLQDN